MFVTIEEIRENGLVLDESVGVDLVRDALQEGEDTGFRAVGGFELHAEFHKVSGGVLLHGKFKAEVVAPCKRCLADVKIPLPVDFTLNLVPEAMLEDDEFAGAEDDGRTERAGSFDLKDADEEVFDGRTIELDPILREQVLLALPMQVVCREECKGLCAQCGQNLNESECGCKQDTVDPRLAVLKTLKLN